MAVAYPQEAKMSEKRPPRLYVIFFAEGYVGIAPTIIGLVHALCEQNAHVLVCGARTQYPEPGNLPSSCTIHYTTRLGDFWLGRVLFILLRAIKLGSLVMGLELIWYSLQCHLAQRTLPSAVRRFRRVNIGVDYRGGAVAWWHAKLRRLKHVYLSLELTPPTKFYRLNKPIFWMEGLSLRSAAACVIQDQERLTSISKYHNTTPAKVFFLPNSPGGKVQENVTGSNGSFLHERLGIDTKRFPNLLLLAGMVRDEVYCRELAEAIAPLDIGVALVIHSSSRRTSDDPYIQELRALNDENLYLSLEPVEYEQVDDVYSSAKIGIVYYRPVDDNFSQIAIASGKLPSYLKHGVPIIANRLPSTEQLISETGCGLLVDDPGSSDELRVALETIMSNYDEFSRRAKRCFATQFDFDSKCRPLVQFLSHV